MPMNDTVKALNKLTNKKARLVKNCAELKENIAKIDAEIAVLADKLKATA